MNRKLTILALIGLLLFPTVLLAQPATGTEVFTTVAGLIEVIERIGGYLSMIIFSLAIIFILVSAFQFLTAAGNPEKITSARQVLIYALVAVAIAVVAWGLPKLVKALLTT